MNETSPQRTLPFIHEGNVSPSGAYASWHQKVSSFAPFEHLFLAIHRTKRNVNEERAGNKFNSFEFRSSCFSLRSLAFHSYEHKYWQGGFIHLRSFVLKSFLMRKNSFLCFRSGWLAFVVRGKLMLCQLGVERWWMELTVVSPVLPQKLRFPLNDHQVLCAVVVRHERQREMERM